VRREEECAAERLNDEDVKGNKGKRKRVYVYEKIDNPFLKEVRR